MTNEFNHEEYMAIAIEEAVKAEQKCEVPIGAVLVDEQGHTIAAAHNQTITRSDPTAHAEILVLRKAAGQLNNYRLLSTTLYATVEPCIMCMGAIVHARVQRVVFGAHDSKWGAAGSLYDLAIDTRLNHRPDIISGICEHQCRTMMQNFFKKRRK
jgi:tRNA(adenine34) deaminase